MNVLREYEQADAGGDLEFVKLRTGAWIVSRWQVRMPTSFRQDRSDSYGNLRATGQVRATEMKTTGGDVLRVIHKGDTVWAVPPRAFEGTVLDSSTHQPVPGARVSLAGTPYATVTNELGRFRIEDVLPGAYAVRVHTPELDSLAAFHLASAVVVSQMPQVDINVPNRAQLIERWCPEITRWTREISGLMGMVLGIVRDQADSTPVVSAEIGVEWMDVVVDANGAAVVKPRHLISKTDLDGVYRICGPPWDHRLRLSTAFDGPLPPLEIRIGDGRVRRLDFWISNGQRIADSSRQR